MKKFFVLIVALLAIAPSAVCQVHTPACPPGTQPYAVTRDSADKLHDEACWNLSTGDLSFPNLVITPGLGGSLKFADNSTQSGAVTGFPQKVAAVDLTGQTAAIGTTTLYTPASGGKMYLLSLVPYVNSPTGTSTVSVTVVSTMHGFSISVPNATTTNATASQNFRFSTWGFYPEVSTAIQYSTTWTSGGAGDSYDLHLVLLQLP